MKFAVVPGSAMPHSFGRTISFSRFVMTGFLLEKIGLMINAEKTIAVFSDNAAAISRTDGIICVDMIATVRVLMIRTVVPMNTMPNSFGRATTFSRFVMTDFVIETVGLMLLAGEIIAAFRTVAAAWFSAGSTICADIIAMVRLLMILTVRRELTGTGLRLETDELKNATSVSAECACGHVMLDTQRTRWVFPIGVQRAAFVRA
jgi:hypothetical protein